MKTNVKKDLIILTNVESDLLKNSKITSDGEHDDAKSQLRLHDIGWHDTQDK